MIIVNERPYYAVQEVIKAGLAVWPAGEHPSAILETLERRPGLGFEVKGENMSHPGESRFVDVDSLADVLGWPAARTAAVIETLRVQRPAPDYIGGTALPISRAEQASRREAHRSAAARGEYLPREPEIHVFRGRGERDEPVNVIRLGDARI